MLKIEIPKFCPCCASTLEIINEQLFCRNVSCGAQLNKKLQILGNKTIYVKKISQKNKQTINTTKKLI